MDVPQRPFVQPSSAEPEDHANCAPADGPGMDPTPDYGTLGPGSDVTISKSDEAPHPARAVQLGPLFAVLAGVLFAVLLLSIGSAHAAWSRFATLFSLRENAAPAPVSARDSREFDRMKPQKQAEALLELAVGQSDGAVGQISSRVDDWQGKLKWTSQIATLSAAALNSNDMRVRQSGVEVELAAYGLSKNTASLNYLLRSAESKDHAQKIWALWALGLIGNRGVGTPSVVQTLTMHLKDSDEDSRRWAIEGLALVGADETIPLLLTAMHDDQSPAVRERAACSLAASGMFTREQRMSAVPQLLNYTDDPALDAQTHIWAFMALGDISGRRLPNDSAAWRSWYENNSSQ
jgi:HEAT repeats